LSFTFRVVGNHLKRKIDLEHVPDESRSDKLPRHENKELEANNVTTEGETNEPIAEPPEFVQFIGPVYEILTSEEMMAGAQTVILDTTLQSFIRAQIHLMKNTAFKHAKRKPFKCELIEMAKALLVKFPALNKHNKHNVDDITNELKYVSLFFKFLQLIDYHPDTFDSVAQKIAK